MNELVFFEISKQNLKIQIVKKSNEILEQIRRESAGTAAIPDVAQYYTDIYFPKAPSDRPHTLSSIMLSSDGKMAYGDNPSGPLIAKNNFLDPDGSLGDFWVLNALRAYADGIIIDACTLLSGPDITCHVYEECLTGQRREVLRKKYQPCGVIVSLDDTDIPFDHYIFDVDPKEEHKLVIATSLRGAEYIMANSPPKHPVVGPFKTIEDVDHADLGELYTDSNAFPVIVTGQGENPDTKVLMYALKKWGLEKLYVKVPSYCTHLLQQEMLDEYFINYSMVFAGGQKSPGYASEFGHMDHPHADFLILGIHESNFTFTHQKIRYSVTNETDLSGYKYWYRVSVRWEELWQVRIW